MASTSAGTAIRVTGMKELRRALRGVNADMSVLTRTMKQIAEFVAVDAGRRAPWDSGELAHSLRPSGTQTKARIRSYLPYAGPIHWGWPRRNIRAQPFMEEAAQETASDVTAFLVRRLATIARDHGFETPRGAGTIKL